MRHAFSAEEVSGLLYTRCAREPSLRVVMESYREGLFIGLSDIFSSPFFIDFETLMNMHIFIFGISGGGKTYLMRNLMIRLSTIMEKLVIVIDLNGEYRRFADACACKNADLDKVTNGIELQGNGIIYVDLSSLKEEKKVMCASAILENIARSMRKDIHTCSKKVFIVMDEAWKILHENKSLEVLIREGRKYGIGVIAASQSFEDIDVSLLGNISTVFVFRLQNSGSLDALARNYALGTNVLLKIQNLEVGSCLVIHLRKSGNISSFFIKKVVGMDIPMHVKMIFGGGMVEVLETDFEAMVKRLLGTNAQDLMTKVAKTHGVELHKLVSELVRLGSEKIQILEELRKIGIEDCILADAFAYALEVRGELDDEKFR